MLVVFLLFLALSASRTQAETTCPALRDVDQEPQRHYFVYCSASTVPITQGDYQRHAHAPGGNWQQFCPGGETFRVATTELRWQTASGFPQTCDVYTGVPGENVRQAPIVRFLHADGADEEIVTSEHALVYEGNTLVGFSPPVPGITVGSQ